MADFSNIAPNIIVGTAPSQSVQQIRAFGQEKYKADVQAALDAIWNGSWTGTAIIQGIAENSRVKVIISPFLEVTCNAGATDHAAWAKPGEFSVEFTPADYSASGSCAKGRPGTSPDAVLLHELVHAYRQIRGHSAGIRTLLKVPGFKYEDEHEFYAILLTNIHMSAKGERILRRDHDGYKPLYPELSSSEPFLKNFIEHRRLVGEIVNENSALCNTVRRDQCAFNPIDYFMKNRFAMIEMNKHRYDPLLPNDPESARRVLQQANEILKNE